ncbi:MAG: nicotinate-nucleotide adenylyltransferase [Paludibacteraceae bacterium]|nr:nicotinate-nucleotide adenylyltransferase [Paludibacteraceae bacterium]
MRQIGLFFGSFNPIHLGHTQLAQTIYEQVGLDEIWFVVSPHNPLKDASILITEQQRLHMVELAIADMSHIKACDIEFSMPKPSYTINTLRSLQSKFPDTRFYLIIGTDNLSNFTKWKDYQTILADYSIITYPRQGDDIKKIQLQYPQVRFVEAPFLPISSTDIRNSISQHTDTAQQWLNPRVLNYIKENYLYQ